MSCEHPRWVPESPLSFKWTTDGVLAIARCVKCGERTPRFTAAQLRDEAATPRWNTDNEGDPNVSPLVGK